MRYGNFGYVLGGSTTIDGIEVAVEGNRSSTRTLAVELSWDGGASWTSAQTVTFTSVDDATVLVGGTADTWGRTWAPAEFNNGSFLVRATAGSGGGNLNVDQLQIKVIYHTNTDPTASDSSETTDEDTPTTVAMSATDADLDTLTYTILTPPTNGSLDTLTPAPGVNTVQYTPVADYNGPDSFTFKANDGTADSNTATVSLTVNAVNDAPVAVDDSDTVDEDASVTLSPLTNDTDIDGGPPFVSGVTQGTNGMVVNNEDGTVTYTPDADFNGSDSFTYTVSDGSDTDVGTVDVTVNPINDAPIANDDAYSTDEDTPLGVPAPGVLDVLGNDTDLEGDSLTAVLVMDILGGFA